MVSRDAEYQSIGVTFDTLVDPVDRAAFGAPSDIDGNGRVIIFFTRAVNELTSAGSRWRDARLSSFRATCIRRPGARRRAPAATSPRCSISSCPTPAASSTEQAVDKSLVLTLTNGTVAHEYQHLINASRRMYVNGVGPAFEEPWLDEGLAHVAEELNFFRSANRSPRTNLDATGFNDPKSSRTPIPCSRSTTSAGIALYLGRTETQAPIGFDAFDDDLQTRGAIWNFLRYAADHLPAGPENAFWFNLVNSHTSGVANLTNALGHVAARRCFATGRSRSFSTTTRRTSIPDISNPSWNIRSVLTGGGMSTAFPLLTHILSDNVPVSLSMVGYGVSFLRFSVASGQDALLTVTSDGQPLPPTMQLSVVRVR